MERFRIPIDVETVKFHSGTSGPAPGSRMAMVSPAAVGKSDIRSAARRMTPVGTSRSAILPSESPEVFPCRSVGVAVAVMAGRPAGAVNGVANVTWPLASVVTSNEPSQSSASPPNSPVL